MIITMISSHQRLGRVRNVSKRKSTQVSLRGATEARKRRRKKQGEEKNQSCGIFRVAGQIVSDPGFHTHTHTHTQSIRRKKGKTLVDFSFISVGQSMISIISSYS